MKAELIKRLEVRLEQLTGDLDLGYSLHPGHHCRDVITMLAFLKDDPKAEELINNLPLHFSVQTAKSGGES